MSRGALIKRASFTSFIKACDPRYRQYFEKDAEDGTEWFRVDHANDNADYMEGYMSTLAHLYNRFRKTQGLCPLMRNQLYVVYP